MKTQRLNFDCPIDLHKQSKKTALDLGLNLKEFCIMALKRAVEDFEERANTNLLTKDGEIK